MLIFNLWILMLINEYIHLSVNVYSQMINITSNSIKGFECSNHPNLYLFCIDVEIPWSCKESSKADGHVKEVHAGLDLYHWLKSKKFRGIATWRNIHMDPASTKGSFRYHVAVAYSKALLHLLTFSKKRTSFSL